MPFKISNLLVQVKPQLKQRTLFKRLNSKRWLNTRNANWNNFPGRVEELSFTKKKNKALTNHVLKQNSQHPSTLDGEIHLCQD